MRTECSSDDKEFVLSAQGAGLKDTIERVGNVAVRFRLVFSAAVLITILSVLLRYVASLRVVLRFHERTE